MLKQRVITALILFPITVIGILKMPSDIFALAVLGILLLAGWEWTRISSMTQYAMRVLMLLALAIAAWGLDTHFQGQALHLLMAGVVFWALMVALLPFYQGTRPDQGPRWQIPLRAAMFLVLLAAWAAYSLLHELNPAYVLYLVVLSVTADTAAYFSGKRFGKHKLAPSISPGKTREGLLGALVAVALLSLVASWYFSMSLMGGVYLLLLSLLTALISVVGDLFVSLMKRESGQKDSGSILPGHGGILDRADSHIATAPVFTLGLLWWQGLI
jgi:phosphatidate cytidylyltransferase